MSIELIIDCREHKLINILETSNISKSIKQLDIGDILFKKENETILIIERKTINDLKASICDGRAREQKARLLGTTPRNRILYLIEGSFNKPLEYDINGLPLSTLIGSLINTLLRDDIKVYKTFDINETAEFIRKLFIKLNKDIDKYFNTYNNNNIQHISPSTYSSTLKKVKKTNMTPEVWFLSQLSLIPHISQKISTVIVEKYSSVTNLVLAYEKTPEHLRSKLLSDITYITNNGKSRRIGNKISERVYIFFYNNE